MKLYTGVVENRDDPLEIGRCQVRIVGLHTENKVILPTADLPWAHPMTPITSASMNGIGQAPVGPVNGSWVLIMFTDEDEQQPIMMGTLPGIPQSKAAQIAVEESGLNAIATNGGVLTDSSGQPVTTSDGTEIQVGTLESVSSAAKSIIFDIAKLQSDARVKAYEEAIAAGKTEIEAALIAASVGNNIGATAISKIDLGDETTFISNSELQSESPPSSSSPIPSSKGAKTENLDAQPTPLAPSETVLKKAIPIDPPPGSTSDTQRAKQNIQLLIDACDRVGLTSKYAKAAILGICGGESGWLPVEEGHYYSSAETLAKIFKRTFASAAEAKPYEKWKGTAADFFKKIYAPTGNGSLVGNTQPNDGALYYGRGFNQLTGRPGYLQAQNFLKSKGINVDLMNNPNSVIDNPETAALCCAAYYALNVKHDQNDPGYFVSALKRTGADANGTGYAKKQKYYEYFLGQVVHTPSTNKPSADTDVQYTPNQVRNMPPAKQAAVMEDRSDAGTVGFKDPTGKYPLRNLLDEPDTNRMARGVQKETALDFKDSRRSKYIPAANDGDAWNQPLAPFGGKYPYSKVLETESGHMFVMDDTPTQENISLYHRAGSFLDIDANGTQVNKIIGDGYTIIDRNGFVYITGKANVTVGNGINILVQGSADIQVNGTSTVNLKGRADIGVAGDLGLTVGGNFNVNVAKDFNVTANNMNTYVKNNAITTVVKDFSTTAGGALNYGSASFNQSVSGQVTTRYEGNWLKYYANTWDRFLPGSKSYTCPADGSRSSASDCVDVTPLAAAKTTYLKTVAPEYVVGNPNQFQNLVTPVRPSPPIALKKSISDENEAAHAKYLENPAAFYNPEAAAGGVKPNYAGTPKDDPAGQSLISGGDIGDIAAFLEKHLQATNDTGYWRETGQGGKPSNPNIIRIWSDLGYPSSGMWLSDQTAWCAGFVNWTLKQCGYRYVQTASAKAIQADPSKWNATPVPIAQAQPGDIVLWNYSHVNFVYKVFKNGSMSFVGGNQSPRIKGNNPNDGDVTISWPAGWTAGQGGIVGIWRPSKK